VNVPPHGVRPLSPPPHILWDPQIVAPLTDLPQRERERCSLSGALQLSQKFPVNGLPRFPDGPLHRETPVSRAYFCTFPSKSPVNEPHSMFSNRVPMEREASSPETMVYPFIYICQSPQ